MSTVRFTRWGNYSVKVRWQAYLTFMRHKFIFPSVKKWSKSVHIYGSYGKIKMGTAFLDHSVHDYPDFTGLEPSL